MQTKNFAWLVNDIFIGNIISPLVPLLIGVAVIIFLYGVIKTMLADGGEKKEEGKSYMFWGIIGLFVMVSLWGLVNVVKGTFNLDNSLPNIQINVPKVK